MEDQTQQQQVTPQETPEQKYERLYSQQTQTQTQSQQELLNAIQSLQQEVQQLKSTPVTQPQEAQQTDLSPAGSALWVEKIRQGDFEGAQRVIVEETQRSIRPQLEQVRQEAYNQAVTATTVNLEMDKYLSRVRQDNPDMVHFERYLQAPVEQRIQTARDAGKVKTGQDLIREYKAAVDAEVAELRNLGLQFRAAGKSEALTRNREVLSQTPLQPQQVQLGNQANQATEAQPETTDDYFARRRADEARRRGMAL